MWSLGVCQLLFVALVCGGVVKKDEGEGDGKDIVENIIKINEKNHLADEGNEGKDVKFLEGDIVKTPKLVSGMNKNDETDIFQSILNANAKNIEDENDPAAPNPTLVEGDIVKTKVIETYVNGKGPDEDEQEDAINVKVYGISNWPVLIPYYFEPSSSRKMRNAVYSAISEYEKKTCLRFKEIARSEGRRYKGYIQFFRGAGCYSYIGMQGGEQQISIGNGCEHHGIAVHEIMHALGFFHEQARRDRDNYIKVHFENIPRNRRSQFKKYNQGHASTLDFPYDTSSIMHYGPYAFSANGRKTITLLPGQKGPIGQRNGLSEIDVKQLKTLYCSGKTTRAPTTRKPTTRRPTTRRPTTRRPSGGKCVDRFPRHCPEYEARGECYRGTSDELRWIKANCCATCAKGNRCHDYRNDCETSRMRAKCNVGYLRDYMRKHCAKTCGACR